MAYSSGSNLMNLVVDGDVTMDCNIAHIPGSSTAAGQCKRADFSRACWQRGGAALLAELSFRNCRTSRPSAITEPGHDPWVVLKISVPVTKNNVGDTKTANDLSPGPP